MRYVYPADLEHDEDGVTVTFEDIPGATYGATEGEALARASDFLVTALAALVEDGEPIPRPKPVRGRPLVSVTVLEAAKLALHDAMLAAGLSNVELARRMDVDEKAVRRLRDPLHRSQIGQVEAALRTCGRRLVVEDCAA